MSIGPDDRFDVPPGVHARTLDEELVILDLAGGDYWALDPLGARVWERLAGGRSLREIVDEVGGDYDVAADVLLRDLVALAGELAARRLLVARRS